jgi:hypothetical protein
MQTSRSLAQVLPLFRFKYTFDRLQAPWLLYNVLVLFTLSSKMLSAPRRALRVTEPLGLGCSHWLLLTISPHPKVHTGQHTGLIAHEVCI